MQIIGRVTKLFRERRLPVVVQAVLEQAAQYPHHVVQLPLGADVDHDVDRVQRIVQKMRVDLRQQHLHVGLALRLLRALEARDEIGDFNGHLVELIRQFAELIPLLHLHLCLQSPLATLRMPLVSARIGLVNHQETVT